MANNQQVQQPRQPDAPRLATTEQSSSHVFASASAQAADHGQIPRYAADMASYGTSTPETQILSYQEHIYKSKLDGSAYELYIAQQPEHGKVFIGKEKERKPIDPPPCVQLRINQRYDPNQRYLTTPYNLLTVSLAHDEETGPPKDPDDANNELAGTRVSSLHRLKDCANNEGAFFIFGDLSAKVAGRHKLLFTLYEVRGEFVDYVTQIKSDTFTVFSGKTWPGMGESTELTKRFCDQGVRLRLRKEPRFRLGVKGPASEDYQPRSYKARRGTDGLEVMRAVEDGAPANQQGPLNAPLKNEALIPPRISPAQPIPGPLPPSQLPGQLQSQGYLMNTPMSLQARKRAFDFDAPSSIPQEEQPHKRPRHEEGPINPNLLTQPIYAPQPQPQNTRVANLQRAESRGVSMNRYSPPQSAVDQFNMNPAYGDYVSPTHDSRTPPPGERQPGVGPGVGIGMRMQGHARVGVPSPLSGEFVNPPYHNQNQRAFQFNQGLQPQQPGFQQGFTSVPANMQAGQGWQQSGTGMGMGMQIPRSMGTNSPGGLENMIDPMILGHGGSRMPMSVTYDEHRTPSYIGGANMFEQNQQRPMAALDGMRGGMGDIPNQIPPLQPAGRAPQYYQGGNPLQRMQQQQQQPGPGQSRLGGGYSPSPFNNQPQPPLMHPQRSQQPMSGPMGPAVGLGFRQDFRPPVPTNRYGPESGLGFRSSPTMPSQLGQTSMHMSPMGQMAGQQGVPHYHSPAGTPQQEGIGGGAGNQGMQGVSIGDIERREDFRRAEGRTRSLCGRLMVDELPPHQLMPGRMRMKLSAPLPGGLMAGQLPVLSPLMRRRNVREPLCGPFTAFVDPVRGRKGASLCGGSMGAIGSSINDEEHEDMEEDFTTFSDASARKRSTAMIKDWLEEEMPIDGSPGVRDFTPRKRRRFSDCGRVMVEPLQRMRRRNVSLCGGLMGGLICPGEKVGKRKEFGKAEGDVFSVKL